VLRVVIVNAYMVIDKNINPTKSVKGSDLIVIVGWLLLGRLLIIKMKKSNPKIVVLAGISNRVSMVRILIKVIEGEVDHWLKLFLIRNKIISK